ncbi:MAG TPA: (2Fe-2S)-binding protein [Tepidisphaeraceae bacterium]|nr:(2Fe-2S)-binding protein [Tepidisphaeraceae bacterium]
MSQKFTFVVNGKEHTVETDPQRPLLDVLREDLGLTGAKYGCGETRCGACSVLVGKKRVFSCSTAIESVEGKQITTIEGLAKDGKLHPVQQAFFDEEAYQCGYCTPGMIMATIAMLNKKPHPSDDEILTWMDGNLCRCCGYPRILKAVRKAAGREA